MVGVWLEGDVVGVWLEGVVARGRCGRGVARGCVVGCV